MRFYENRILTPAAEMEALRENTLRRARGLLGRAGEGATRKRIRDASLLLIHKPEKSVSYQKLNAFGLTVAAVYDCRAL